MRDGLLPLFPLQVVLFPRTSLSLHIFEERYKEMIGECLVSGHSFGVVLAQGQGILRIGCTATIEKVLQRYDDGRLDILTMGRRRFEISEVDTERSFLRASVSFFDDDETGPVAEAELQRVVKVHKELRALMESDSPDPDIDDPQPSFQFAQISPDLGFRQTLLAMRSEPDRLGRVADHLAHLIDRQRVQAHVKKTARGNGHPRLPLKLNE